MNTILFQPNILFVSLCVFTFQPGNLTGLGEVKELKESKEGTDRETSRQWLIPYRQFLSGRIALVPNFGLVSNTRPFVFLTPPCEFI